MIKASFEFTDKKLHNLITGLSRASVDGIFDGCTPMIDEINERSEKEYVITASYTDMEVLVRPIDEDFEIERGKKILLSEETMTYRSKCYIAPLIKERGREGGTQPIGWITRSELLSIFRKWKRYISSTVKDNILSSMR
ncbi:MAG: hypothetical protein ACTSPB_18655 [Candidatus Thorarchaeota archaeon]